LSTFNPKKAPIGTWILSVARNVVRDHRRNQRRWTGLPLGTVWNRASPDPTPETGALERERHQQLLQHVGVAVSAKPWMSWRRVIRP
jgi:DNA-directed RNA polymerase specialized sigma24 family protein